jgi:hypothetical protein
MRPDSPKPGTKPPAERSTRRLGVRDRRYAIRYPFDAAVETLDLESGVRASGTTTDISLGGCFVRTTKPATPSARVRVWLTRDKKTVEVLARVRSVKPGIGMGLEFVDLDDTAYTVLQSWINALRSR